MTSHAHAPEAVQQLAERLKLRHGDVRICREKSGWHLYFASPAGLQQDGRIELTKKHLAVNAEKYLAIGAYAKQRGTYSQDRVAQCMKTGKTWPISELLQMPTLAERGIPEKAQARVSVSDTSKSLVRDANGNMVPDVPGVTVPLAQLPPGHPAIQYLTQRGFSIPALEAQFRACFCVQEAPEDATLSRWYRKGPMGFKDTPQNRIIFYVDVQGVCKGWQARYLECEVDGLKYVLHPYTNQWVAVARRQEKGKPIPLPGYEEFDLSKYKTAFGARRNEIVMGFDAAVRWNQEQRKAKPVGIVVEGPLDAARAGPPGMAVLGKSLSDNQAALMATAFRRFILVADNDTAGQTAKTKWKNALSEFASDIISVDVPSQYKDLGEMPAAAAAAFLAPYLQ
jgi:hypothetical protein